MATTINQISDTEISVNGKMIYRDVNGRWVTTIELTTQESEAVQQHIKCYDN